MTTPRGPRGNRRPRVAGRPVTRPTGPERPTSRPGDEPPTAADDTVAAPIESSPPPTRRTPEKSRPPQTTPPAEPADSANDDTATPVDASETADAVESADTAKPVDTSTTAKPVDTSKSTAGPRGKSRPAVKVSTIKPQSTRPAPKRPTDAGADSSGTTSRRRRFLGWRAVGTLAAIAVVVGVVAGVAAARPGVSLSDNEAFVDASLTSQVSAQAKTRICTVFAVNYAKLDDWERTAKANVTGEASNRFTQYAGAVRDAIGQTGLTQGGVDCRVDTVGVRSITGDSATLVVNLILSQTDGQQASGSGTKRYQVAMQRVDGQWLVSNFSDF